MIAKTNPVLLKVPLFFWICWGAIFFIACGRLTPPRPVQPKATFHQLKAIQRGDAIWLSWVMQTLPSPTMGIQQFEIEETTLAAQCLQCQLELVQTKTFPFPSEHFLMDKKQIYLPLSIPKDIKVHSFKVTHKNLQGEPLGEPQVVYFTHFVDFPLPPALQWKVFPAESLPKMEGLEAPPSTEDFWWLRLSWKPLQEKVEFYFSNQETLTQRPLFYRVNIYKTQQGKPWPFLPINPQPIAEAFYIDYQLKTTHPFVYQIRLVDSKGNESVPSHTYTIAP